MIGQLQNKFGKIGTATIISAAIISMPVTSHAETVSAELVTTDWLIFVKSENSELSELSRHLQGPANLTIVSTTLNLNISAENFDQNYLYILVGNRLDGLEPYLAGSLNGSNTVETGDRKISVLETNFKEVDPPTNIALIKEIAGQKENGAANVFRIPYSALLTPPAETEETSGAAEATTESTTEYVQITEYVQDPDLLADHMVEYIGGLTDVIKNHEVTIRDLNGELTKKTNAANSTLALLQERDSTIAALQNDLNKKSNTTEPEIIEKPLPLIPLLLAGVGLLGLEKGMVFAPSQMMVGGSSLPLNLAAIQPAYDAVGRIGFAQESKPTGKDEAFGTGILISDRHVLTNRHVWEMFKHRLASDEGTGIEFYGLKKSDKSEFIEFDGAAPICIEGWDAAIFTLKHTPENRRPVSMTPRPAEELNDLDIVVVGYPQAYRISEEIEQVTEDDPIFAIKRYSEGKIFKHSTDDGNPYGVETLVDPAVNASEYMPAICHNASTLGGSSGSAIICKDTGDLIALHFGFDSASKDVKSLYAKGRKTISEDWFNNPKLLPNPDKAVKHYLNYFRHELNENPLAPPNPLDLVFNRPVLLLIAFNHKNWRFTKGRGYRVHHDNSDHTRNCVDVRQKSAAGVNMVTPIIIDPGSTNSTASFP